MINRAGANGTHCCLSAAAPVAVLQDIQRFYNTGVEELPANIADLI